MDVLSTYLIPVKSGRVKSARVKSGPLKISAGQIRVNIVIIFKYRVTQDFYYHDPVFI
jgi:hypothetical protein